MTISSQSRKAGPFTGNGSTAAFPFAFKVFQASDVYVVRADTAGAETVLTMGTHYSVTLNSNQNSNPGGTVTLTAALTTNFKLVITSAVPNLQPTDLTNQGGFYPKVINDSLDRLTMMSQQLKEQVDRSAKLPITSSADANALVADIVRLADNVTPINTVAGSINSVNTTAANIANVNTAAGSIGNVNTVGTNIAAVNTAATNIAAIQAAPTQAANAAAAAAAAGGAATAAGNSASNAAASAATAARYQGPAATNPTTRLDGSPIQQGDTYFNTVALENRVYNGTIWQAQAASPDTLTERSFLATAGQTSYTFTGGYRVNATYVWVNGVMLYPNEYTATDGTTITFADALALNDEVRILSLKAVGSIVVADVGGLQAAINAAVSAGATSYATLLKFQ